VIRALVFNLDGTLVETEKLKVATTLVASLTDI
jgi:beta-phosphoglucomutase-like phosphatase (HAD superfamily)